MAADLLLSNCATEGDLAQLGQAVLNQASLVRDQLLAQIAAINPDDVGADLAVLNGMYDQQIAPNTNDNVAAQVGLPTTSPDEAEDEARLEPLGLVLVRGIVYGVGTDQNIEEFRKLFFAVGSNVQVFLSIVNGTDNLVVIQTRLTVRRLPQGQQWTLAAARTALQNDAIEQIYLAGDGFYYAVVPTFLGLNKSATQVSFESNTPIEEIVTQVFWLRQVETNSARINQLVNLGLGTDERTSILTNQPVRVVRPTAIETLRASTEASIKKALDQMTLLNGRFAQVDQYVKQTLREEIQVSIREIKSRLYPLQQKVRFSPVLISRPEDINVFLELNPSVDLPYLFATKRTVRSIDFQLPRETLMQRIQQASAIPAGSNTVSSILSNQTGQPLDYDVNQTNLAMVLTECGLTQMSKAGALNWNDMQTAYTCLSSIRLRPVLPVVSNIPVIGYDSFDSPSSILFRRAELRVTLKMDNIFEQIINLAKPISDAVEAAMRVLIAMIKSLRDAVDQALKPLIQKVADIQAQIEAFLSRHASYFATASLDSSILKCALNLDLQLSLPFLADIAPLLEVLRRKLKNLLAQVAQIVGDFVSKLMCLPINFLNDMLKSATSFLPSFCKTDTFKLPPSLEAAFLELQQGFQLENTTFVNFSRNLLRLQASVEGLPAKVEAFQESLVCNQTPLNSRFMTVFRGDIDSSFGTNPLGQVAKLIPPRG